MGLDQSVEEAIDEIRSLATERLTQTEWYEATVLALSVLHDTVGGGHPVLQETLEALRGGDALRALASAKAVVKLFDGGRLVSPRLAIAHELEGDILEIAQQQVGRAETAASGDARILHLAIAAFLAGAALEDALRRLCNANNLTYDHGRTTIAKLQTALYQPLNGIEVISTSDTKQITAWADTRNKTDHGKLADLTLAEVLAMVVGVRGFLERRLP